MASLDLCCCVAQRLASTQVATVCPGWMAAVLRLREMRPFWYEAADDARYFDEAIEGVSCVPEAELVLLAIHSRLLQTFTTLHPRVAEQPVSWVCFPSAGSTPIHASLAP